MKGGSVLKCVHVIVKMAENVGKVQLAHCFRASKESVKLFQKRTQGLKVHAVEVNVEKTCQYRQIL